MEPNFKPKLKLDQFLRHMLTATDISAAEASRRIGKSNGYLTVMLSKGTMPGLDTFTEIADACGYTVEVHGPMDMEVSELHVEGGELVADCVVDPRDVAELSQVEADAREALKDLGRKELIDDLIAYLEGLKGQ